MNLTPPHRTALCRLEIIARRELAGVGIGQTLSRQRGQGMEFSDLRPYQPGDDIRRLDFSASARTGVPYTRIYREERAHTLTLLADVSASMTPAKRQLLAEAAALLAFAAVQAGNRLALVAFTDRIEQVVKPARGLRQAQRIAGELFTLQPQGRSTDLQPALAIAGALNRRPGQIILLSDLHTELPGRQLQSLCARHELLALLLRDAGEITPPPIGLLQVIDSESQQTTLLDITSVSQRQAIGERWQQTDQETQGALARLGIRSTVAVSGQTPLPSLRRLFLSRGVH